MTIVTVTPNPALDLTYTVDRLRPGEVHRVASVHSRPGGKGVNVARVVHALGLHVRATGLVGGADGESLRGSLADFGIDDAMVTAALATRRTVNIVDTTAGTATLLNEPGPHVDERLWGLLVEQVASLAATAEVTVISGSLPPGLPPEAIADLVEAASRAGSQVIVDTSGPALRAAVGAQPSVLKPNADELHDLTGVDAPPHAARSLHAEAGGTVVASLGAEGLLAVTDDGVWTARLAEPLSGNPTGAGDSVVAALAAGIRSGREWPAILRDACALSAATVLASTAGEYDAAAYRRLLESVVVTPCP